MANESTLRYWALSSEPAYYCRATLVSATANLMAEQWSAGARALMGGIVTDVVQVANALGFPLERLNGPEQPSRALRELTHEEERQLLDALRGN